MILGEAGRTAGSAATLDDLFRRAGVRHPDAVALVDPPNRERFTDGAPRTLTFAQADRAISAFAARLRELGLHNDAPIALQLPNTVDSVVALLGVLRAGMIAVQLPLLWRRHEIVSALGRIGAKAIVTAARVGSVSHAEIAMQAAVDLFQIRHVCAFGRNLPDGLVPLDDIFSAAADSAPTISRTGPAAAHVAAITFGLNAPVARNHVELVAGGLEVFLETDARPDTPILSTIPVSSFAGIALTVMPWLLSGGILHLHHGFDPDAYAAQLRDRADGTIVMPGAATAAAADAGLIDNAKQTVIALWRAPERLAQARPWHHPPGLVDVASFAEIGLLADRRGANGLPAPTRHGLVDATRRTAGAPTVAETARSASGTLMLRGRMVPTRGFPPESEPAHLAADQLGYVDTGFACQPSADGRALIVTAPPAGTTTIGGYRFRQNEVDELVGEAEPDATIVALPDADLGQRLAGAAANLPVLREKLQARGVNPLIAGAFRPRGGVEAA